MTTVTEIDILAFQIQFREGPLADLQRGIAGTRPPDKETVPGPSQGVQLATIQELMRYAAWEQPELFCSELGAALRQAAKTEV